MANEPERPIEKLLRDAARKRRDMAGGPFDLHPATRRLLQGEVTRRFAKRQGEARSFSAIVAQLWPRFAWALGILAVLGVAVWVLLPGTIGDKPQTFLARNQPVSEAMPTQAPQPPAPTASAASPALPTEPQPMKQSAAAFADKSQPEPDGSARQLGVEERQLAKEASQAPARSRAVDKPLPAAAAQKADRKQAAKSEMTASGGTVAQSPTGTFNGGFERRYGLAARATPPAPTTPASVPAPPVAATPPAGTPLADKGSMNLAADRSGQPTLAYKSLAESDAANRLKLSSTLTDGLATSSDSAAKEAKSLQLTQRFAQVTAGAKAKAATADEATPAHPVLASFQVEQTGSELRIVDADGSVYRGYVQAGDTARRARAFRLEAPAAAPAARAPKDAVEERYGARLDSDQVTPQSYSFRVTGTNLSLHKQVVFTGNLLPAARAASPSPETTNLSVGTGLGGFQTRSAQELPPLLPNSRISGKVVVGNGKAVEIIAEPAGP